jgi:hypothetical protein
MSPVLAVTLIVVLPLIGLWLARRFLRGGR